MRAFFVAGSLAFTATAAPVDWSKVPSLQPGEMVWLVSGEGKDIRGMFGIPESDGVLLWFSCAPGTTLAFSYVDPGLKPLSTYRVHLKTGRREVAATGRTGERLEFEDLVIFDSAPLADASFLAELKRGGPLAVILESGGKPAASFALPPHGSTLAPFFKACGV